MYISANKSSKTFRLNLHLGFDSIWVHFRQVAERFYTNIRVLNNLHDTVVSIDTDESAHVTLPVSLQDHHMILLLRLHTVQHVAGQEDNIVAKCNHATAISS